MSSWDLGKPLGNPLALKRKESNTPPPLISTDLATVKITERLPDSTWQYLTGQTITNAPFKMAYGSNRMEETITRLVSNPASPGALIFDISLSPDGTYMAAGHSAGTDGSFLTIYKRSGDQFAKLPSPAVPALVQGVCFSPDGNHLAVCLSRAAGQTHLTLVIFKRDGDSFAKIEEPAIANSTLNRCAYSPDGKILAVTGSSLGLRFFRVVGDTYTEFTVSIPRPASAVGVAFSFDGKFMAVTYGATTPFMGLYSVNGEVFAEINRAAGAAIGQRGVAFSPDGKWLAFGINQPPQNLTMWKRDPSGENYSFSGITPPGLVTGDTPESIKFSASSKHIIARTSALKIWRINNSDDGMTLLTPTGTAPTGGRAVEITPDDSLVIVGASTSGPNINIGIYGSSFDAILPSFPGMIIKVTE